MVQTGSDYWTIWFRFGMAQNLAFLTRQGSTALCGVAQYFFASRRFLLYTKDSVGSEELRADLVWPAFLTIKIAG